MDTLSPDQARALWAAGGFFVLGVLPQGSEFGVDGTYHTVRRFSGVKFVPPGLHLFTWTPAPRDPGAASSSNAHGPGALPIRSGLLHHFSARERLVLKYDPALENVPYHPDEPPVIISDDALKTLDASMAGYPFEGLENWKSCISLITPAILNGVVGEGHRVDGMMEVDGEATTGDQDLRKAMREMHAQQEARVGAAAPAPAKERQLQFVKFDVKRSWPPGTVGEDLTKWSKDKSWLLNHIAEGLPGSYMELVGQLQLAFILLIHLSAAPCLAVYQRILRLFCQSRTITEYVDIEEINVPEAYIALVETLTAQLHSLPTDAFLTELPELDAFYLDQISALSGSIQYAGLTWSDRDQKRVLAAWDTLEKTVKKKFSWSIPSIFPLAAGIDEEDDEDYSDSEEEGEYAPVVVDT